MSLKLYVLIRDDLSEAQQAVQAGHAVAQFGLEHPADFEWWQKDNNTLIYLSVRDIRWWKQALEDGGIKHSVFHEPDIVWHHAWYDSTGTDTSIAVAPNWTTQYVLFKDLPLAFKPKPTKRWWQR